MFVVQHDRPTTFTTLGDRIYRRNAHLLQISHFDGKELRDNLKLRIPVPMRAEGTGLKEKAIGIVSVESFFL